MRRLAVALLLLSVVLVAGTRPVPADGSHVFFLAGRIADSDTTGTAANPEQFTPWGCGGGITGIDAMATGTACLVPIGWQYTVRSFTVMATNTLGATEACIIGVSGDATGVAVEAWSDTQVGASTTPTCDVISSDGDLDTDGEYCYNTDATGLVAAQGTFFYVFVDEITAGNCDSINTLSYVMEIEAVRVSAS